MKYGANRSRKPNSYKKSIVIILAIIIMLFFHIDDSIISDNDSPANNNLPSSASNEGEMTVHFLDVGQGSSTFIQSEGHNMLIDGGDRSSSSFVVSYLQKQGITSLDYVLVSHYHADHLNGIVGVLNAFDCKTVICPDYEADTKLFHSFCSIIEEKGITRVYPSPGDSFTLGGADFTIISPTSYDYSNENNNSIGIRIVNGQDSFLFTGDAEAESEEDFCKLPLPLSSDVYTAGHHGSASSTTWSLLERVLPEYVVISCGRDNSYGHPHEETMEKLEAVGAKIFRTDTQGTIVAVTYGDGITWNQSPAHDYSEK